MIDELTERLTLAEAEARHRENSVVTNDPLLTATADATVSVTKADTLGWRTAKVV